MSIDSDIYLTPLPWHRSVWRDYYRAAKTDKLHHALLLQSSSGSGKTAFIKAFAKLLLCVDPYWVKSDEIYRSCGKCSSCLWYTANTHPNYYEVAPHLSGANKPFISIDQIRDLTQSLQSTAMNSAPTLGSFNYHTVVVIDPTDVLQVTAVHALLKTLEEPIPGVVFILASAKLQSLAPTIKSRCQSTTLPEHGEVSPSSWLKSELLKANLKIDESLLLLSLELADGMPLKALHYLKNNEIEDYQQVMHSLIALGLGTTHPGETAQKWALYPVDKLLDYLMLAVSQLTRLQLEGGNSQNCGISAEVASQFSQRISVDFLFQYWDKLSNTRYEASLYTLNATLMLEMLAYAFSNSLNFS